MKWIPRLVGVALVLPWLTATIPATAQSQVPPRQQPPRGILPPRQPSTPPPATTPPPAAPATAAPATEQTPAARSDTRATAEPAPSEAALGAPVYPGAVFLGSFDAGKGQRYYLFGLDAPYAQVVAYYRNVLRSRGSEVFDVPPVWSFDLARFREESMAYPPSVTIRDHVAGGRSGYAHAEGTTLRRFATVIQIVPPPPGSQRR